MKMHMIACIYSGETQTGFRILDSDTGKTMDVTNSMAIQALKSGNSINNLEIKNGGLHPANGDFSRYPKIANNKLIGGKSPAVVLNQIDDVGYTVTDYTGHIIRLKNADIIKYAAQNGIANGKVSSRNGEQFISAISGSYDKQSLSGLIQKVQKDEAEKPVEKEQKTIEKQSVEKQDEAVEKKPDTPIEKVDKTQVIEAKPKESKLALSPEQKTALKNYYTEYDAAEELVNSEVEYINETLKNKQDAAIFKKTPLLNEIIAKLRGIDNIVDIFGPSLTKHLITFIKLGIPFTKSITMLAVTQLNKDAKATYDKLFPNSGEAVNLIFEAKTDTLRCAAKTYLEYLLQRQALGEFKGYDSKEDLDTKKLIADYALCTKYNLDEARALIGVIDLNKELYYEVNSALKYRYHKDLASKLAYYTYKFKREVRLHTTIEHQNDAVNAIDASVISVEESCKYIDNSDSLFAGQVTYRKLTESPFKEYENCLYNSTPQTNLVIRSIEDVYRCHLVTLSDVGHSRAAGFFMNTMEPIINDEIKSQAEKDRQELENLAAEMQRKREEQDRLKRNYNSEKTIDESKKQSSEVITADIINAEDEPKTKVSESKETQLDDSKSVQDTVTKPATQKSDTVDKSAMQSDIKSGANLDKYDRVDLYNELKRMVPNKPSGIYFEIADDMMKRKLTYRDMSSRQKYRFNQAIDKLLDQIPGRPANNSTSGSSNTGDTTTQQPKATSVNNTYLLDERQDIATNVNRLVKLADSVEMNAVLAAEPNVLNICYSILRYKKASDRQLLHVNNAIKILDEQ